MEANSKYQNIANREKRIIVDVMGDICIPENWEKKYTYYLGMYHTFDHMSNSFIGQLHSSSYINVELRLDGSLCTINHYRGIHKTKNYLFRKSDTHCYTIDENGKASIVKYSDIITGTESKSIIGCCSKLEFNNFKPIRFDFQKNQIEIEETHEIIGFANMGVLTINRPFDACYYIYDIVSFEEFLKNYGYNTDAAVTNILNSYRTITTKYQELFQDIKKSYYKQDFSYIEVHCNSENIFRFPKYLLPLLKSSPLNCNASIMMSNHTAHDIDEITLLKVVKIMEYMIHTPNIDFIDLLKNDTDCIDLGEIEKCADYIGAYIIVEFTTNITTQEY